MKRKLIFKVLILILLIGSVFLQPVEATSICDNVTLCPNSSKRCQTCYNYGLVGKVYCGGTLTWSSSYLNGGACSHGSGVSVYRYTATCSVCQKQVETVEVYSGCSTCTSGYNTTVPTRSYCTVAKTCPTCNGEGQLDNTCTTHNITGEHYVCTEHDWVGTPTTCSGKTITCTLPQKCTNSAQCTTCGGKGSISCGGTINYDVNNDYGRGGTCSSCRWNLFT